MESSVSYWLKHVEQDDNESKEDSALPEIPNEPMEFLSRSWTLSANEISKAFARNNLINETDLLSQSALNGSHIHTQSSKVMKPVNGRTRGGGAIGRLFHHSIDTNTVKKKDKARIENAHMHAVLSVAGLAAALAAAVSTEKSKTKMSVAMTSATELLASYCIELAESTGADKECVASVVQSAVGIRSASDLSTLTAAAATALRGEAALKSRLPKEAKRSAAISPYEKAIAECHSPAALVEDEDLPCVGHLLQLTRKGVLRWKHVSVDINNACQLIINVKSKHVGGAFSKNSKCILYEVIEESSEWPFRKETENMELYFGVKTAHGLLEFKCKNKVHKQKWVNGIQKVIRRRSRFEDAENSLRMLNINKSI